MENGKVLKFAQEEGYATITYLSKFKEYDLYKPLYDDTYVATGLPVYIIVKNDKPEFVMGKAGLKFRNIELSRKI